MNEELGELAKERNIQNEKENPVRSKQAKELSAEVMAAVNPLIHFLIASKNFDKKFGITMLEGAIGPLILTITDSVDEAPQIVNNTKQYIINLEKDFNKKGGKNEQR